jgi:hypothetical protein
MVLPPVTGYQWRQRQNMPYAMHTTTESTYKSDPLLTYTTSTDATIEEIQLSWIPRHPATTPPCTPLRIQDVPPVCPNAPNRSDATWFTLGQVMRRSRDTSPSPRRTIELAEGDQPGHDGTAEEGQLEHKPIMGWVLPERDTS